MPKRLSASTASRPTGARPKVSATKAARGNARSATARSNGRSKAESARTAGKRTAKPDKSLIGRCGEGADIRGGGGKGAAQITSKTRAANESQSTMDRDSPFRRMATTRIKGHRSATDRRMQARRDSRNG